MLLHVLLQLVLEAIHSLLQVVSLPAVRLQKAAIGEHSGCLIQGYLASAQHLCCQDCQGVVVELQEKLGESSRQKWPAAQLPRTGPGSVTEETNTLIHCLAYQVRADTATNVIRPPGELMLHLLVKRIGRHGLSIVLLVQLLDSCLQRLGLLNVLHGLCKVVLETPAKDSRCIGCLCNACMKLVGW